MPRSPRSPRAPRRWAAASRARSSATSCRTTPTTSSRCCRRSATRSPAGTCPRASSRSRSTGSATTSPRRRVGGILVAIASLLMLFPAAVPVPGHPGAQPEDGPRGHHRDGQRATCLRRRVPRLHDRLLAGREVVRRRGIQTSGAARDAVSGSGRPGRDGHLPAGRFGLALTLVIISLDAMRTGLLTRNLRGPRDPVRPAARAADRQPGIIRVVLPHRPRAHVPRQVDRGAAACLGDTDRAAVAVASRRCASGARPSRAGTARATLPPTMPSDPRRAAAGERRRAPARASAAARAASSARGSSGMIHWTNWSGLGSAS